MDIPITRGSGNVFADLGLPDAEELHAKARLNLAIKRIITERGLTQVQAAKALGIDRADVSNLINGKLRSITLDRLTMLLNRLDQDVEITWHPKTGERARTVAYAQPEALAAAPRRKEEITVE